MTDAFDEFLATGTTRRKTISLYADQAAAGELEALSERATGLNDDELEALAPEWDALKARWEASRADVTIVRLSEPIREQVEAATVIPDPPRAAGTGATAKRIAEAEAAQNQWAASLVAATTERSRLALTYGIERFEFRGEAHVRELAKDGTVTTPALSPERLDALFAMDFGPQWQNEITETFNHVSKVMREPDVPFSLANSGNVRA